MYSGVAVWYNYRDVNTMGQRVPWHHTGCMRDCCSWAYLIAVFGETVSSMDNYSGKKLNADLSGVGAWAYSLGTSVGWGSLVVTSNTYLAQAGPAGSVIGLIAGAFIMLIISRNYAYMMTCYPDAGGAYTYCRDVFGYDHGFLTAWFLALTYLAMLWANATSLPLFFRFFLGDHLQKVRMYEVFGYDVYLGETLLSITFILLTALICTRFRKTATAMMTGMAFLFSAGIVICFIGGVFRADISFQPAFIPDSSALSQIIKIAVISPWAFIGFENISHASEEFSFSQKRIFRVLSISVIAAALLYIFVMLLSVTAFPPQYGSWLDYIRDIGNLEGIEALPAFYAARHWLGDAGVIILVISLLALILTSLIGNMTALSRLFGALGKDGILPVRIGVISEHSTPSNAIKLIAAISAVIPFLGRTAIGWIVDVTTLGATLIYGFVSAAAWKTAGFRNDISEKKTGLAGLVLMIGFGLYLLVPNLFTEGSIEPESYFLFVAWAMLGFLFFWAILKRDSEGRFGKSIVVWIALLSLILFVSLVWMNQSIMSVTDTAMHTIETVYTEQGLSEVHSGLVSSQMHAIRVASARSILVVVLVFALSLVVLLNNYRLMSRQAEHSQRELLEIRDIAGKDSLTGVKNKLSYSEIESEMNGLIASGQAGDFALAVLDVNGLKHINDTLGHQAGDEYILKSSRMICMYFPHSPVFRVGGDEFIVLIQGPDYENREEILDMFKRESETHIGTNDVVISLGSTDYRPDGDRSLEDMFRRADSLMYENKNKLKNMGAVTRS